MYKHWFQEGVQTLVSRGKPAQKRMTRDGNAKLRLQGGHKPQRGHRLCMHGARCFQALAPRHPDWKSATPDPALGVDALKFWETVVPKRALLGGPKERARTK